MKIGIWDKRDVDTPDTHVGNTFDAGLIFFMRPAHLPSSHHRRACTWVLFRLPPKSLLNECSAEEREETIRFERYRARGLVD